ncbi:diguanylate cyclase [Methylobacterium sp. Leaf456]|uniref:GGDEF domain-containing protein n=1 Tax=Methylobacterium sp. Leaf456 TaxID=1736382 RepID=UPI000701891D|nr:GGDEF domain-containing protein [Methylobacterium sp. Leaf456]KQT61131.1 diguanylate cyclase [Methylobacterium sp. Leaf456]
MDLSVPTLQFTDSLVFGSCGAIFLCAWWLQRQKAYFLLFGLSYAVCAGMAVWFVDFGSYGSVWSPLGWSLAGSTFWVGLRQSDGRRATTGPMLALFGLPTTTHILLTLAGFGPEAVNTGSTLTYALHETAMALDVLAPARSCRSPLRQLIGLALLATAVAIVLPVLPLGEAGTRSTIVLIFVVDHVASIILTTSILALEAEKAHAVVARMARTDPLTGALNREGLSLAEDGAAAGVILADLDHFKSVNDRFGHAGGDAVLREFARRAGAVLPASGHLARLGGEEFAILLPGHDPTATAALAERLRHGIGRAPVPWKAAAIPVTVSLGVAMRSRDESLHTALERADAALYAAKAAGRDRVRVA